jgi:quercetin dioxygenase-like cupin family protein
MLSLGLRMLARLFPVLQPRGSLLMSQVPSAFSILSFRSKMNSSVRRTLLTASIEGQRTVGRVEVREIDISANQKPGAHIHPCPVVSNIVTGTILFQVEGQPVQVLEAGDVFFEPANTKIVKFATTDQPAQFIAYFLLGRNEQNVIKVAQWLRWLVRDCWVRA